MIKITITSVLMLLGAIIIAQSPEVVHWTFDYNKETQSIDITADMDDNWVIYSQFTDPDGPIPLNFTFEPSDAYTLVAGVVETNEPTTVKSEMFGVEVKKFKHKAVFKQKIEASGTGEIIKGAVTFMCCDNMRCLPPKTLPFEVKI